MLWPKDFPKWILWHFLLRCCSLSHVVSLYLWYFSAYETVGWWSAERLLFTSGFRNWFLGLKCEECRVLGFNPKATFGKGNISDDKWRIRVGLGFSTSDDYNVWILRCSKLKCAPSVPGCGWFDGCQTFRTNPWDTGYCTNLRLRKYSHFLWRVNPLTKQRGHLLSCRVCWCLLLTLIKKKKKKQE